MTYSRSPKTQKPVRYVSYVRCSTDDQAEGDFTTTDTQRAHNRRYIEERITTDPDGRGGVFAGEYKDEGKTGTNLKRPDWKRLLADAEAKRFDVVVVTYMSRLARGKVFHVAEHLLLEERVRVEMVREKFTNDLAGSINKDVKILADGMYVEQVREWTKTKQAVMVERGYHTGGCPAFGYSTEPVPGMLPVNLPGGKVKPPPKRRVPDPEAREIVLRAFEVMDETDNMGCVQRYLRAATPERAWSMESVRRFLCNEVYRGVQRFGENNVNPSAHEAIIPEVLWDRVQGKIAARADRAVRVSERTGGLLGGGEGRDLGQHKSQEARVDTFPYYLRGRAFCAVCGGRMTPASHHGMTTKVRYYECVASRNRGSACPVRRVNARVLHGAVLAEIARCGKHPTRLAGFIREAVRLLPAPHELKEEARRLRRNRGIAERNIRKCVSAIETASLRGSGLSALTDRIRELEAHIGHIDAEVARVEKAARDAAGKRPDEKSVAALWADVAALWEVGTETERAEFLALLVERVEFTEKNKGVLHLILQNAPLESSSNRSFWVRKTGHRPHPLPSLPSRKVSFEPVSPRTIAVPLLLSPGNVTPPDRREEAKAGV